MYNIKHGFLIVQRRSMLYRGVDREPVHSFFGYTEGHGPVKHILNFFDKHSVTQDDPLEGKLIDTLDAAKMFFENWGLHKSHEVLEIIITPMYNLNTHVSNRPDTRFLGFDVAYEGGDFYSAIKNGLFVNPSDILDELYKTHLNRHGLFDNVEVVTAYLDDFLSETVSESREHFVVYAVFSLNGESALP